MKEIRLQNSNKLFTVDDEDEFRVKHYKWWLLLTLTGDTINGYVDNKKIALGRFILNYYGPSQVDHKDRNIFINEKI